MNYKQDKKYSENKKYGGIDPVAYNKEHEDDVCIGALEKDGEKLLEVIEKGEMVAILSGMEVMYVFIQQGQYQCFIHKLEAEDGRFKSFEINERNRAMLKNLPSAADQVFEITNSSDKHYMGVMVAAETGIIRFLDYIGALPVEDADFMSWQDQEGDANS